MGMSVRTDTFSSSLLSLPFKVRRKIYIYAGLVRACAISLHHEADRWSELRAAYGRDKNLEGSVSLIELFRWQRGSPPWTPSLCALDMKITRTMRPRPGMGCLHCPMPIQLLLVSRKIYSEAMSVLHVFNTIIVGPSFKNVSWLRMDLLRSLEIQMTTCSCIADHRCPDLFTYEEWNNCRQCHYGCKRGTGTPLTLQKDETKGLVDQWQAFCLDLGKSCSSKLELTLICDCADIATAKAIVRPFSTFPTIYHANIRLGQSPSIDLSNLAQRTSKRLVGAKERDHFPFLMLPSELQVLVLKFTDLVAPDLLSWYEPVDLEVDPPGHGIPKRGNTFSGLWLLENKQDTCCLRCSRSGEVCACPSRHAAYTSRYCRCWSYPRSLFLVSRHFRQQAIIIFLSQNQFTLWESKCGLIDVEAQASESRLARPIKFLREIPADWSSHLRWVRLIGRDFHHREGFPDSDVFHSWLDLTSILRSWPSLEQLTFELILSAHSELEYGLYVPIGEEENTAISLWNIASLFKPDRSQSYKDFFIRLDHSVSTAEKDWARWYLERALEKHIMGEDYNATERGKYSDPKLWNESLRPKRFWVYETDMWLTDKRLFIP